MKQMAVKPKYLLLVIMVLVIMALAAAPAGAAEMPVHVAPSDGTLGGTANYTIKAYLQSDWVTHDWLVVWFPFQPGDYSFTDPKYTTASGPSTFQFGYDRKYLLGGGAVLRIRLSSGTIPAGSLVELTLTNISNPASAGTYPIVVETRHGNDSKIVDPPEDWGAVKDSGSFDLKLPGYSSSLNLSTVGNGEILVRDPASGYWYKEPGATFTAGTLIKLEASPDPGWAFARWEGDLAGMYYFPPAFFVDGNMSITAVFVNSVHLNVSWTPHDRGTVSPGSGNYAVGYLELTATPSPGWHVDVWEVTDPLHGITDSYGGNTKLIYMDRDKNLITRFKESEVYFNITSDPAPGGTVAIYPHFDTYKGTNTQSTLVELTPTPAPGYRFAGWEYQVPRDSHAINFWPYTSTANPLSFEVDTFEIHKIGYGDATYLINGPVNVKAVFVTTENFQLTTFLSGHGSISRSIGGPEGYPPGTEVTLTATSSAGTEFSHWSGDLDGLDDKANPITVVMDSHKTIGAHFVSYDYDLTVICSPAGGGSVDPPGGTYPYRTYVNLTATPNPGWYFTGWSGIETSGGDSVDGNKAVIVLRDNRTVTASFAESPYNVTYDANGGTGTAPDHDKLLEGDNFTAVANPFAAPFGTLFKEWNTTADGSGTGYAPGATVTMPAHDLTLYAIWEPGLFFSEYVCASGGLNNNKALEIYNPSHIEVDLAAGNYKIEIYFTLYSAPETTINLTGTIPPRSVYVLARVDADQAILATANQTTSQKMFTGNDTIVLSRGTVILDVFGQRGEKPTYGWKSGDIQTWNTVLRRLPGVTQGDRNPYDVFDPALEWEQFSSSDFSGLGWHLVYPAISIDDVSDFEGDSGTTDFIFTVSLSSPAGTGGVTFDIATADGTAAAPEDYIAKSLTGQTIPEDNSSYTFIVQVIGDTLYEPDKTFYVNITNVTGAIVAKGQGVGTILNDDDVTFTVTFNSQGGSPVDSQTVNQGDLVTQPADPVKEGYGFAGWFTDTDYNTQWNFSTDTVTADMTLYAKWTEVMDSTAPIVTLDAMPTPTTEAAPTFTGTAGILAGDLAAVTVNVYSGSSASDTPVQTLTTTRDGSTGAYSVTAAALADGTYTARAEQSDSANNIGYSEARTFVVATISDNTLTVATNPAYIASTSGSGEYSSGETVSISAPASVDIVPGKSRYLFTGWSGDGVTFTDASAPSTTLTMPAGDVTVTANYVTQYYLTVDNGGYGDAGGAGWYDAGASAQATVTSLIVDEDVVTRYVFAGWSDGATGSGSPSDNILMDGPKTATATWTAQYRVTFAQSGIGDYSADRTTDVVVTVDGITKTAAALPFTTDWLASGTSLTYNYASPVGVYFYNNETGDVVYLNERYAWASTSGLSQTQQGSTFAVTAAGTVTASYDKEYKIGFGVVNEYLKTDCTATEILTVTVNGIDKTGSELPFIIWAKAGDELSYKFADVLHGTSGTQYVWFQNNSSGGLMSAREATLNVTRSMQVGGAYCGSLVTLSPTAQQYGDDVTFNLTVSLYPYHQSVTDVHFYIGTQDMGRAVKNLIDILNNAYSASITVPLLETVSGELAAGNKVVTAKLGNQDSVYNPTTSLTIIKADQAITFGALDDKTYGDDPFYVSAETSSGLPVSFAIKSGPASISDNTVTITGAETVIITATQAGNSYYHAASDVEQSFNVARADAVITLDAATLNQTYNGSHKVVTATPTPAGLSYNITYDGSATAPTNAGSYGVVATIDDTNYQGSTSGTLTINKADAIVSVAGYTGTYDGAFHRATGSATGVMSETLSGLDLGHSFKNVPGGTAQWAFTDITGNYKDQSGSVSITISKASLTVTADAKSKVYGEADPTFTYQVASGSLAAGDVFDGDLTRAAGENVGSYAIQQGSLTAGPNYTINFVPADFTITPKNASVTPAPASKTYGDTDPTFIGILDGFLAADGVSATYSRTAGETVAGSPYTISATLSPSEVLGNYNIASNTAEFTITAATVNILYNGDQIVKLGESFVAKAQLTGPNAMSINGIKVCFSLENDQGVLEPLPLRDGTTNNSGLVTLGAIDTSGWTSGVYTIIARTCDTNVNSIPDEATFTVAGPGDAATGGGWYTLSGAGRVNFGFTVRQVPDTEPIQYKGQILLINNEKWRLKGELTDYVSVNHEGAASGTGKLYEWNAALNGGLGEWVLVNDNVSFTISFADNDAGGGTGRGKKTITPDTFGIHIDYIVGADGPTLPNSPLTELKGGNIDVKITNDDSGDTGKTPPGQSKKK